MNSVPAFSTETSQAKKAIRYEVNGEPQTTQVHKLTGRQILDHAGFTPAEEYLLTRNEGNKAIGLDEDVPIHEGETFTATFRGPTPTS
jgi:hypothetical protein